MDKGLCLRVTVSLLAGMTALTLTEKVAGEQLMSVLESGGEVEVKGPDYYRLPGGVTPLTYELRMIPFLEEGNLTFKGDVTITLLINSTTKNITLHSKGLNISQLNIFEFGLPKVKIPLKKFHYGKDRDFLIVESKVILRENKIYSLYVEFAGELNGDNLGFYKSSYVDSAGKPQWIATTQFQPQEARAAFPCFDEPQLKANFSVSIARPMSMNSLSNMNVRGSPMADPSLPENYVWDHFMETPKMSTYLVAFVVSNFTSGIAKDREFRVWAREEYARDVEYSLEIGPKILDVMKNITQTNYSLPKMDMIAIPDFIAGAMENWGLVTYRESLLLFNNETSSSANKQKIATTVAHECAHQWFGNLVSPEWWTWIWLNEGFGAYFAKAAVDRIEPSWRMMEQFVVEDLQAALLSDSKDTTHPMDLNITKPVDIDKTFDEITYKKSGSVIRMMSNFLSEQTFFRGLRNYILKRQYNSANETHILEAMDVQAKIEKALPDNYTVSEILKSWMTQAGYPVITVKRDFIKNIVAIEQEKFTLDRPIKDSETAIWCIPLTYTSMRSKYFSDMKPIYWMKERAVSLLLDTNPSEDEWILFNLQQTGFYRVNYDEQNWRLLSDYLNTADYHNIPPVNRAQLIDDALNLARAGYLNYSVALSLTSYLERESDYIPLYSAVQGFTFLERQMSNSKELHSFKVHMQKIMKTYYNTRIFEESPEDDHLTKLSCTTILPWACKYDYENCVSKATKLFQDWKENRTSIPSNLMSAVYCFGVEKGGDEDWNYLWKAYQKSSVATEKDVMLKSLGCSRNKTTINSFLEMVVNTTSGIRKHDIPTLFASVCNSPEGLETVLTFLTNNSEEMLKLHGAGRIRKIIKEASRHILSNGLADEMKNFLMKIDRGPLKASAKSSLKTISNNLAWIDNNVPEIDLWLKNKYGADQELFSVDAV